MISWLRSKILLLLVVTSVASSVQKLETAQTFGADAFQASMMESMTRMDRDMRNAPMTGDPDHDFAAMMIPHHQGAIDMAKAELLYGKNKVLRRLAQEIIVTQQSEIQLMQQQLSNNPSKRESEVDRDGAKS